MRHFPPNEIKKITLAPTFYRAREYPKNMTSKHNAGRNLLRIGLLEGLNSFAELESKISSMPGNKERGDAFEVFAEAYIATQKIALAKEVWPFESIPFEQRKALSLDTGRDMGVDGTYLTIDGELRAYQVKFRTNRPSLTWDELSTFMGLTDQVSQRVLFTNCEALPNLMQDRSGFVAIRGSDLDRLIAEDFEAMHQWLSSGLISKHHKMPFPHQQEALTNISRGLDENDRATVVMACGTGKSLVALWAAEQREYKTLLVLVPSLALVRQLLHEWLRETKWEDLSFICVCSDSTVTKGVDELIVHQADLDFSVTTESAIVQQFLSKSFDGTKIVFSTYQSAPVVAAAMPVGADGVAEAFDLGIFDEAHKTASRDGTRFSFALEDSNLPIRKRLFFTATPRHYDIRKKDKEGDSTLVYSMDKLEVYGPVVHTLSFAEAARRNIICDYKVVISVVTSAMVNAQLLQHGEVIVDGYVVKARQVALQIALQIALQKAVEKYGVSRIFTFHGTVEAARSFTSDDGEGIHKHLSGFTTLHVSGAMPTSRREDQMKAFRQAEKAVMSNARCLTEGVDVPAVDMVAFISPRKSKVDIVQATGRAMRKSPGKEFGYVMVPLFLEQAEGESIEDALRRAGFEDIWDLLGAMKEQDDVLTDIFKQMGEEKGRTGGYNESRFEERVDVLGPTLSLEIIRQSITAACLESLGVSWDQWYGRLQEFVVQEGHCRIPSIYVTPDGYRLGSWVASQRSMRRTLSLDRRQRLESIANWVWELLVDKWEAGFSKLLDFATREKHCRVPANFVTEDGFRLGQWVSGQRKIRNTLSHDRKNRLEALSGWTWNTFTFQWDMAFDHLSDFIANEGHSKIPNDYVTPDGFRLGRWVGSQRQDKDLLPLQQRQRLETLPEWVWDARAEQWELGLCYLMAFASQHGNSRVPRNYKIDGFNLNNWSQTQRKNKNHLSVDQRERLNAIPGWMWDVLSEGWETNYSRLVEFARREGHCQIPKRFQTSDGTPLGRWAQTQKHEKDSLSAEKKHRLEAIPGWIWDTLEEKWEIGFLSLEQFNRNEGHCNVPRKYRTNTGYCLGTWVGTQRALFDSISIERKQRLEALHGWQWNTNEEKWEQAFLQLAEYAEHEGHCRVHQKHLTNNGFRLGTWITNVRAKKDTLSPERKLRLEALSGWAWSAFEYQWKIGYNNLLNFKSQKGHCQVPGNYRTTDGYRLGVWVKEQRAARDTLPVNRKEQLESVTDWTW